MQHLRPVDRLVVDVALDNLSDNYSSKPHHVSPEFNNVMAAGAKEISGPQLVHRDGPTELWMAFVADPDGIPVGLMQERSPSDRQRDKAAPSRTP